VALSTECIGVVGETLFDFPLAIALLFAVTVMLTDPVAAIAVLDTVGTPEELVTLVGDDALGVTGPQHPQGGDSRGYSYPSLSSVSSSPSSVSSSLSSVSSSPSSAS